MTSKRLKQLTIIPGDLYVTRDADRQVRQIIEEMGRPGYVLVARQMGKTNLLLNARRELARVGDQFVYVDVSNTFPSLREFFRNIVDTAASALPDALDLQLRISTRREKTSRLPEHQEHELELILLLEQLPGKLVICLDEVDALAKTKYSDSVFAFIRSVYFSGRTNVESFSRLTFLLSGVAEPGELIKNKSISPFNIGAKIYLGDFSLSEMEALASRSAALLTPEIVQRVFHWTSGHPRLSWHLFSLAEDHLLAGEALGMEEIDKIVQDAYLTSFDLPPVDHIRSLVQDDGEIRDALMSMHYSRSESVSASVRTKLYLNGISATQSATGEVHLKNRILELALSEDWLQELEGQVRSLRARANSAYERADYAQAVELYKQYMAVGDEHEARLVTCTKLGHSLYQIEEFEDAVAQLERDPLTSDTSPLLFAINRFYLASSCTALGRINEAIAHFKEVLALGNKPTFRALYLKSLLNIASLELVDDGSNLDSTLLAARQVLEGEDVFEGVQGAEKRAIQVAAHYIRYRAMELRGESGAAEQSLREGIAVADDGSRVTLLSLLTHSLRDMSAKKAALVEAIETLELVRPSLGAFGADALSYAEEHFVKLLGGAIVVSDRVMLDRLISYLSSGSIEIERAQRIVLYAIYANFRTYTAAQLNAVLNILLDRFKGERSADFRRSVLVSLCFTSPHLISEEYVAELAESYLDRGYKPSMEGVRALVVMTRALAEVGRASSIDRLAQAFDERVRTEGSFDQTVFDVDTWEMVYGYISFLRARARADTGAALAIAAELLGTLTAYPNTGPSTHFPRSTIEGMIKEVREVLSGVPRLPIARVGPKIGRNEVVEVRLASGELARGKFKKFESLLQSGQATLTL